VRITKQKENIDNNIDNSNNQLGKQMHSKNVCLPRRETLHPIEEWGWLVWTEIDGMDVLGLGQQAVPQSCHRRCFNPKGLKKPRPHCCVVLEALRPTHAICVKNIVIAREPSLVLTSPSPLRSENLGMVIS